MNIFQFYNKLHRLTNHLNIFEMYEKGHLKKKLIYIILIFNLLAKLFYPNLEILRKFNLKFCLKDIFKMLRNKSYYFYFQ
jgi:hypothetical protein